MNRLLLVLLVAATGCLPTLSAQSLAPPGRTARLGAVDGFWQPKGYRLEISQGVAVAVSCYRGGPCKDVVASVDERTIADVKPGSFASLSTGTSPAYRPDPYAAEARSSAVVIIGKTPGKTRVRLRTASGNRWIDVTVVPPPLVGEPAKAVARGR